LKTIKKLVSFKSINGSTNEKLMETVRTQ
jgi:hypothetical protein